MSAEQDSLTNAGKPTSKQESSSQMLAISGAPLPKAKWVRVTAKRATGSDRVAEFDQQQQI